ncbi:MAG TPA: SUMF1/EgtB/PvdO family nonheme iron enzyme [Bryobacterales bacterium]|nr:SUMF1/EgtB/PvdO family nonheme iron enzyme [Bryobacterales bacterium]
MRVSIASALLFFLLLGSACRKPAASPAPDSADWLHVVLRGRTVHNSHYLAASFLYQLQTLLGTAAGSPKVMSGRIVRREGKEIYIDLKQVPPNAAALLRQIAGRQSPGKLSSEQMDAYMAEHYYRLTSPYPNLAALLREHPYRENPNWLAAPVDSLTFKRRRVLHIAKDRIADALISYFDNNNRLLYPEGTVIAAESFDKEGRFVEAEVLRKRGDTFWNFSVYDRNGALVLQSVAFDEEGRIAPEKEGFHVFQSCALCHRIDRLDLSGDAEAPVQAPIREFFHKLPARVPQIHLGPEYYDHMAFTELTEANGKIKDGVFGVYGSLLLSELACRKRLGELTADDRFRYERLRPYFPELLTPLERIDSFTNSIGLRLVRIPPPHEGMMIGSLSSDPYHRRDELLHQIRFHHGFFMGMYDVTNAQFRRFRPNHHIAPYRGVNLDGDEQPVVNVSYDDAQAFIDWLNSLPAERAAGRTYRLPTEEEWEYAAQGSDTGEARRFPWGDQWPPPEGAGNFADEANGAYFNWEYLRGYHDPYLGTSPVGKFWPNPYFLYDMAGNVYQWTSSYYEPYPGAAGGQPYSKSLRVIRGSSWADELPKVLRCAFRNPTPPAKKMEFLGFRVAADIPELR